MDMLIEPGRPLDSFSRRPFPRIAAEVTAFRALLRVPVDGRLRPAMIDLVLMTRGRTQVILQVAGPIEAKSYLGSMSVQLARKLASRMHDR
jgi:hypothetical protein